ncbi:sugar transferase [Nocardia grenadensis]|uniref:sugar transferase n=1 Tax=Nocardia grenadensis TaxID=931537 RepID=UPI003D8DBBC1
MTRPQSWNVVAAELLQKMRKLADDYTRVHESPTRGFAHAAHDVSRVFDRTDGTAAGPLRAEFRPTDRRGEAGRTGDPAARSPSDAFGGTVSNRHATDIEAELRRYPGSEYITQRPEPAPGEPVGAAWIDGPQHYAWEREWLTENSPRISSLSTLTLASLEAETALRLTNATPGPHLLMQPRPRLTGEILPIWKFRTLPIGEPVRPSGIDTASRAGPIGRIARHFSLDEFPQFGYLAPVGARPILDADLELMRQVLSPVEQVRFNQIPRDGLYTSHYPLCRGQQNQSPEFLRTRYLADVSLPEIGSRTFHQYFLDDVVAPYQRREAHQLLNSYIGRDLSAEDRISHWFATTVTATLDAAPSAAPRIVHEALQSQLQRDTALMSPEDREVQAFVAKVDQLMAGNTDFGTYLQHRELPEMRAYAEDVVSHNRHRDSDAKQVPLFATIFPLAS